MDKIIYGLGESTGSGDFQWNNIQSPKESNISLHDDNEKDYGLELPKTAAVELDDREKLEIPTIPTQNRCGTYTIYNSKNDDTMSQSSESSSTSETSSEKSDSKPKTSIDFEELLFDHKNILDNLLIFDPTPRPRTLNRSKSPTPSKPKPKTEPEEAELKSKIECYENLLKSSIKISSDSSKTKIEDQKSGVILISHYDLSGCYKKFSKKIRSKFGKLFQFHPENLIKDKVLKKSSSIIIAGLVEPLAKENIQIIQDFVQNSGGSLLVLCNSDNSLTKIQTTSSSGHHLKVLKSINELVQSFGLQIRNDSVIRANSTGGNVFHPKECLIPDALNCPGILTKFLPSLGKIPRNQNSYKDEENDIDGNEHGDSQEEKENLNVFYPFGSTIKILNREKIRPFMSSGITSFPTVKPIGVISLDGKIIVLGTGHCFHENYFDLEDNEKLLEFLLCLLSAKDLTIDEEQFIDIGISENHGVPSNAVHSSEQLRVVLAQKDSLILPGCMNSNGELNPSKLVQKKFFGLRDNKYLVELIRTRKEIGLEDEGKLQYTIKPIFQTPLPKVKMALFDPVFRTLPRPALELFDLDAEFAHPSKKINEIASKCDEGDDGDLEYFAHSIGNILDINKITSTNLKDINQNGNPAEIAAKTIVYKMASDILANKGFNLQDSVGQNESKPAVVQQSKSQ